MSLRCAVRTLGTREEFLFIYVEWRAKCSVKSNPKAKHWGLASDLGWLGHCESRDGRKSLFSSDKKKFEGGRRKAITMNRRHQQQRHNTAYKPPFRLKNRRVSIINLPNRRWKSMRGKENECEKKMMIRRCGKRTKIHDVVRRNVYESSSSKETLLGKHTWVIQCTIASR